MSRSRNRNITQIFGNEFIRPDNVPGIFFGEYIFSGAACTDLKETEDSIYQNINTTNNLTGSKSSSSSLSWGDDCESEATQRVKYEYDKLNNVLSGVEAIPPYYDKDEYKLWIKTFPSLRQIDLSRNNTKHPRNKCDNISFNETNSVAVIADFLNKAPYKVSNLTGDAKISNRKKRSKIKQTLPPKDTTSLNHDLQDDFSNLLRISPAPTYNKHVHLENRRLSTNYIGRGNVVNTNNKEYTSLPHLLPQVTENYLSVKSTEVILKKSKRRQKANRVVLPPIDTSLNQFRSISAIPLQQTKCSSALSTKTNFLFGLKNPESICNSSVNQRKLNGYY